MATDREEFERLFAKREASIAALARLSDRRIFLKRVAAEVHHDLQRRQATWEPHDWSDFS